MASKKIAKIDADAMNSLYASELVRVGGIKVADVKDQNGAPKDPQAFKDHEEYLATLESVLKEDAGVASADPNDVNLD
jgi:hypothetical protein